MSIAHREDTATIESASKTGAGYLRAPARLTRTGIFEYKTTDGRTIRELRPAEEVFAEDSLDSLRLVPVTLGHPAGGLDAKRARAEARGSVGEAIKPDGNFVSATLGIYDEQLVAAIESGVRELSCGYSCEVDPTPGEYNGERYDAVQRTIRYNHVAVVQKGRAGAEVAIRLDENKGPQMVKLKIGEVEHDVPEAVKAAFDTFAAQISSMMKKDEADALKARADSLEAQVAKLPELAKARASLEREAAKFVPAEKFDGQSDIEIKKSVISKLLPEVKLDGVSDAYVDGAFATAIQVTPVAKGKAALEVFAAGTQRADSAAPSAHQKMIERQNNAWKTAQEKK
jgi:hypothetical protein